MPTPPPGSLPPANTTRLIQRHAARQPDAAAISDRQRRPLSYAGLADLVVEVGAQLRACGVGPGDRVAIVLPNGPEMATCFLAVAGVAAAAPLNPAYRGGEFEFSLGDLRARALVVERGVDTPARDAAAALGIAVFELTPDADVAGKFTLASAAVRADEGDAAGAGSDAALVLHTSGTTARPKIVPLTQANLCASASNIAESLQLSPADRCLNVMPLFHIHGLVGALLSSIHAGGSVICERSFDAAACLAALAELRPTWYTAVPTMHQAIVAAATRIGRPPEHGLRFIRSCSSALPPTVLARLEETFGVPAVEAYGMTEASHQMTINPLPPAARKPGSVGRPAGVAVAIMDAGGNLLPAGAEGEVVVQGPNVTAGYENNPQANFAAFDHGWFRTGDQGRLDAEGYLILTGRIKELINRGGEKVSPREIDDALLAHPDVAQAMAFALPHPTLGEDIAAAVVAKEGRLLDAGDLRRHVATRLAEFKTPQRIVIVSEIPQGPTGKPQRIGLAEKLGLTVGAASAPTATSAPPREGTERRLAELWARALDATDVRRDDNFFARGGDSLSATALLALVEERFRVALPIRALFESGSLAEMAAAIQQLPALATAAPPPRFESLVPFQTAGGRPPLFLVHPHSGRSIVLGHIAPHLDANQPFYGFTARGMEGQRLPHRRMADMAAAYVRELQAVQPAGPYLLGGFCAGGIIAYEMAQQLTAAGQRVALLVLIDAAHPRNYAPPAPWLHAARTAKLAMRRWAMGVRLAAGRGPAVKLGERIVNETMRRGVARYSPRPYAGRVALVRSEKHHRSDEWHLGWEGVAIGGIELIPLAGDHAQPWTPERIGPAARRLQASLTAALSAANAAPDAILPARPAQRAA